MRRQVDGRLDHAGRMEKPRRIVIRTPNYLGDTCLSLPALTMLREAFPDAAVTVITPPHCADVFRDLGVSVWTLGRKGRSRWREHLGLARRLRREKFDLGVLFHASLRDAALFAAGGVRWRIGYVKEGNRALLSESMAIERGRHYAHRFALLVHQYLVDHHDGDPDAHLPAMHLAARPTEDPGVGTPRLALLFGSDNKSTRRYPRQHTEELVRALAEQTPYGLVFLGDRNDATDARHYAEVATRAGARAVCLADSISIGEMIDHVAAADAMITIDSSTVHVATAVGTPFVLIVGLSSWPIEVFRPLWGRHEILMGDPLLVDDRRLTETIPPGRVLEALRSLTSEPPAAVSRSRPIRAL